MNNTTALKKNIVSNVILFLLNGVIGFWLPPFLIKNLGVSAYGMIPLATTLVSYATIITIGVNGSLSRFLMLDIGSENFKAANITFNTALTAIAALLMLLAPLLFFFSSRVYNYLDIPNGLEFDSSLLFIAISFAFLLTSLSGIFSTSAYISNRLDLVNRVTLINTYTRVALVLIIYLFIDVTLFGYGIAFAIACIPSLLYSIYLFRNNTPYLTINPKLFKWENLTELLSMGWWLIIIQLGSILFLQIDLLAINRFMGVKDAGNYSVILQWSNMIRAFAISLSGALSPLILKLYSSEKVDEMLRLTKLSNKLLSLFLTCIVSVLIVVAQDLLSLWISPDFSSKMKWLFILVLIPLPVNLGIQPVFSLNRAYNKVKVPGIITCVMGVANLITVIIFLKFTSLGLFSVAISSAVILTAKNFAFMPLYTAYTMNLPKMTFIRSSLSSISLMGVTVLAGLFFHKFIILDSWTSLAAFSCMFFAFCMILSYLLLSFKERNLITETILKRRKI